VWKDEDMPKIYGLILSTVILGASGQLCIKAGALKLGDIAPGANGILSFLLKVLQTPIILAGIGFWSISALLWIATLSKVDLTFAYPMLSLGYVIVFLGSWYLFNEPLSLPRLLGAVLVCLGVILISTRG
jgi:multidrug transporter EmrE-like cation transporter